MKWIGLFDKTGERTGTLNVMCIRKLLVQEWNSGKWQIVAELDGTYEVVRVSSTDYRSKAVAIEAMNDMYRRW